jgi:fructosamine-3-kinase
VTADERLARAVAEAVGADVIALSRLGGGDVAESYRVILADDRVVFAKTHRSPPPDFFSTEATGLSWLRAAGALPVPDVLAVSDGDPPFLVLEWIDESRGTRPDDDAFGRDLAALHVAGAASFGRQDRRTTGSRGLPNDPSATWAEFYASRRLLPLARLVADSALVPVDDRRRLADGLEAIAARIEELAGPAEPPARLHGDLWAGNRLVDRLGRSWLIDPACFGGHREFDLAMMRLFGGFDAAAFDAYSEVAPLADGWEIRVALHHLAPLAVHAVKFGGSYVPALDRALRSLA